VLQTRKPVSAWSQVKALKIRTPGGVGQDVIVALGGKPVPAPAPRVFQILQTGAADGVIMPLETKKSFKLSQVAPYTLIVPGGMYYGAFAFIMSPAKLKGLTGAEQKAVWGCSGVKLSRQAGMLWDAADRAGLAHAMKAKGNVVKTANSKMTAEYFNIVSSIETKWVSKVAGRGVDGAAALRDMRTFAKQAR